MFVFLCFVMRKWLYIMLLLLCWTSATQAQDSAGFQLVNGRVLDSGTKEAIAFVAVGISGTNVATITNREGEFLLKVPLAMVDSVIMVSHLGYRTKMLPSSFFKTRGLPVVLLERATIFLPEVLVKQAEAETLMREVIRRIPCNYSREPNQMVGFYREMIRKNKSWVAVAEAVLDVYKAPYSGSGIDQARIYKGRRSIDQARMDTLFIKYQGGVETALLLDLAKNYTDVLSVDFTQYYDVFCESYTAWDDRPLYVVSFQQKPSVDRPMFRGKFYIDAESYAITKVEFNMNVEGDEKATGIFLKKKPAGVKAEVQEAAYLIQFRRQGNHWYYQYSRANLRFRCKWPKRWFRSEYSLTSEMAVTDRAAEGGIRFPRKERLAPNDIIIERVTDFQDADFWENYNIIEPEQTIEHAIRRLARKLKKRQ